MEASNVQINKIEYKNYKFTKAEYFGYEILINDADKYINITKLLNIINEEHKKNNKPIKKFKWLIKTDDYIEFEQELKEDLGCENSHRHELTYELRLGPQANHINGTYIHEDLINYVLMWADKKYAIKISRILKELNNNNIAKVQEMINDLRNQNKELTERLKDLSQKTIYEQSNELSNNSKIKLYKRIDSDIYKLSYDQDKDLPKDEYELKDVFIVNAASNILKSDELRKHFNKGIRQFDKNNYDFVINYIKPSIRIHQN